LTALATELLAVLVGVLASEAMFEVVMYGVSLKRYE